MVSTTGIYAVRSVRRVHPGAVLRVLASALSKVLINSASLLVIALIWEVLPRIGVVDRVFLPPLSEVLDAWWGLVVSGELWHQAVPSLIRSGLGFSIAVGIGVPLGILVAWYRVVHRVLNPVLELFRNTAALALLPVFILVLGIGETSKVAIIVFGCTFPVLLNTISGVVNVDPLLTKAARSLGLSPIRMFQKVVLPAALPTIFTGIRMAGAGSILMLIAAEMVGAQSGLGYFIFFAQNNFQIAEMYATILTISVLGLAVNYGLLAVERHFAAWRTPIN